MKKLFTLSIAVFVIGSIFHFLITPYRCALESKNFESPGMLFFAENNMRMAFLILSGALLFGTTTVVNLMYNGAHFSIAVIESLCLGRSIIEIVALTLSHGILEIPAIIIAGAAGFKIPCEITRYLAGKKDQILTKQDIKEYITLALISIVLIVIAAWIEANITMRIAESMLNSSGG